MVAQAYIKDGYTERAFIKGIPGMYEDVHFEYRTLLADQIRGVLHNWDSISAEEKNHRINSVILKQVLSWDLQHDKKMLPKDLETLNRLKINLIDRMFNIIVQLAVSDVEVSSEQLDLDTLLDNPVRPEVKQEEEAKN
ncbi:hypothetical protein [Gimesia aquarii]|uniref:Uncharacterized protein n=1 Tax=Gimesia aquarii TaxID=2527964 RepID=A0A517WNJ5_9PLAN|nr:hypothetical protein [Gimesia aquarii]QDU06831.1 hypothetical protein V202x_01740 [Gimesia aquarii]